MCGVGCAATLLHLTLLLALPCRLAFATNSSELWALSSGGGQLDRFDLSDGRLLQHLPQPHRGGCTALALHPSGGLMATGDHGTAHDTAIIIDLLHVSCFMGFRELLWARTSLVQAMQHWHT